MFKSLVRKFWMWRLKLVFVHIRSIPYNDSNSLDILIKKRDNILLKINPLMSKEKVESFGIDYKAYVYWVLNKKCINCP